MNGSKISDIAQEYFKQRDLLFHCYIPVNNHVLKKNNRPIYKNGSKSFLGKSQALVRAEHYLISQFTLLSRKARIYEPIVDDIWLMMLFHYHKDQYYTKKGYRKKTLGDLSNHYQIVEDCLQTAKVIHDDNQIQAHDWSRILPAEETALELYIIRYDEQQTQDEEYEECKGDVIRH